MTNGSRSTRRRGVRASRTRLYRALTDAGFRSQSALAEHIADLETLEQAPKDLVSRVFREQPVELQTLERVARALGVEAWQLYRTSDEAESPTTAGHAAGAGVEPRDAPHATLPPGTHQATQTGRPGFALVGGVLAAALALAAGLWWLAGVQAPDSTSITAADAEPASPQVFRPAWVSEPTLVITAFEGDGNDTVADAVRSQLGRHFRLNSPSAQLLAHQLEPGQLAAQLRSDAVMDGEVRRLGRLLGVRVHLYSGGLRQQVWAQTVEAARLDEYLDTIAVNVAQAAARSLGVPLGDGTRTLYFPLAPVQDYYLEGRLHLDGPASELNIRRAQGRFEAALRVDSNYADAHAGLCEALLEEYWMEDAQRALNDASLACGRAMQLAPQAPATRIAIAHLLRVTGRAHEAIDELDALLVEDPDDAYALVGLIASLLALYRGDGNEAYLERALAAADHATAVDPGFWKPPFWRATLAYFAGDLAGAIAAAEKARDRDENEYVLANLGTFYFCADELALARGAYERARVVAPHSYVGDEFLGMLHYLLGDYDTAVDLRAGAIERLVAVGEPEIHEMWGNLADAYLRSGRQQDAVHAFQRAAEIAERDVLQGLNSSADRASRAYYYSRLERLAPERLPADAAARIEDDLHAALEGSLEPGAAIRVAKAWLQYDRPELALRAFAQAVDRCGGYASTPELAELRPLLVAE